MAWQTIPYLVPLMVAAAASIASAIYMWQHYHTSLAKTLVLFLLVSIGWLLCRTVRLSNTDLMTSIHWLNVDILLLNMVLIIWLVFVFQYTGHEKWISRRNMVLISIVPVVTLLLLSTRYHGLVYGNAESIQNGTLTLPKWPHGPWFWLSAALAYVLVLFGNFLLIKMFIRAPRFYRYQIILILLASVLLQLANLLGLAGLSPFLALLTIALLLSVAGPMAILGIFRFRVADIVPVARGTVIDGMNDGVLVLDSQNRILDVNPLVQQLMGFSASELIGKPIENMWPTWPYSNPPSNKEIVLSLKDERRIYDVRTSPLTDWHGNLVSHIVVLRDITDRKKAEMQLENLFEASKLINSTMDIHKIFEFISDSCQKLVTFDYFSVFLISDDKKHIYSAYNAGKTGELPNKSILGYGEGLIGHCITTRETVLLKGTHNQSGTKESGVKNEFMSQIVVPLIIEDECVGALHVSKAAENAYDQEDVDILKPLSEVISSAIRNSSLYNEIKETGEELEKRIDQRSRRVEILLNARQELQRETSWKRGLNIIVESMETLGFDRVGLFLVNFMKKTLDFHIGKGVNLTGGTSISMDNKEYFGVTCVCEKKTIHVKDSNLARGKQIVSSNSFVWVPIVVQDEAFAALAAGNLGSKSVTNEDVKDLEILAGMCGAFIDRTRILIEPVTERKSTSEIKHQLGPMESYIILGKKPEKAFRIFFDLVTHSIAGFVISREYPEKIKKKYKLQKTPMLWLSRSERENTISPDDLPKLSFIIEDFTRKSTESVILLDGLEYLVTQLGFEVVLKYLHGLRDTIILNNSRLVIPVNKEILSLKEFNMLDREFTMLESDAYLFSFLD